MDGPATIWRSAPYTILRRVADSGRQQRRNRRGDRRAPGAAGRGRGHRRFHPGARAFAASPVSADDRPLFDPRLRADFTAVRSSRPACTQRGGPRVVRFGRGQRLAALDAAPLHGVRIGVVRDYCSPNSIPKWSAWPKPRSRASRTPACKSSSRRCGTPGVIDVTTNAVQNHDVRVALPRY